ncbi:GNAT family N-acetyltransferase [Roseovarius aestuarii]|nr:GNAT family N-acetyltransferase [Roseovarius aestuarii]
MDISFAPLSTGSFAWPDTALQQHPFYAQTLARFGTDSIAAQFSVAGQPVGHAQIFRRRLGPIPVAWVPRGPVWTPDTSPELRRESLKRLPRAARWRALWAHIPDSGTAPGLCVAPGPLMAELDLTRDSTTRRAAQHGKWRNRLCRAESADLHINLRRLKLAQDAPLLMREIAQRRARRYCGLPARFTENWPRDQTLIATAHVRPDSPVIAFMLFLLHAPTASYHIGWSGPEGRALNAHTLLLWRACEHLAALGFARLDLGLCDPSRTPGLARFKSGSGAHIRRIGATTLSAHLI